MSKETRAAAITALADAYKADKPEDGVGAILSLVADGLESLDRIATAMEQRVTISPMGEGLVVGELAKFELAIDPAFVDRLVNALERIADKT